MSLLLLFTGTGGAIPPVVGNPRAHNAALRQEARAGALRRAETGSLVERGQPEGDLEFNQT